MESTPLQFARDFERLKSDLSRVSSPENAILELARFWKNFKDRFAHPAYAVYVEEYLQMLDSRLDEKNLGDLTIEELDSLHRFLAELCAGEIPARFREAVTVRQNALTQLYARRLLYVDDYKSALAALKAEDSLGVTDDEVDGKSETEILHLLSGKAAASGAHITSFLRSVLTELEFAKDDLQQNRINCLFVEKDSTGNSIRGRLRVLEGNVEPFPKKMPSHEVTFDNQIRTPEDPFVGVAYDALDALKALFRTKGDKGKAETEYHAHFSIQESNHHFTGDSIGLAFALLSYAQAVKNDVTRHERLLPGDIAVTGLIDKSGRILPVNNDTLRCKVERAFFSPVRYLVLPSENHPTAVKMLKEIQGKYPRRLLRLVAAEKLTDATDDRNIIRAEKVCMGEYITRKAYRYGRTAKVQVPILMVLAYLLVCLIYPKAWPWFDWRIEHLEFEEQRFTTFNKSNQKLWSSEEFALPFLSKAILPEKAGKTYCLLNSDEDKELELAFVPPIANYPPEIHLFDDDGKLLWRRFACSRTSYPGDIGYDDIAERYFYNLANLMRYEDSKGTQYLLTNAVTDIPARVQLICFDLSGNIVSGPYLHTGAAGYVQGCEVDFNHDEDLDLVIHGVNNRYKRAFIAVIDHRNMNGVSPPYDDELFVKSGMAKGSQLVYVCFPETRLSSGDAVRNTVLAVTSSVGGHGYQVRVFEGSGILFDSSLIQTPDRLPQLYYTLDSDFIPQGVIFSDNHDQLINYYLRKLGNEPYEDVQLLYDSLKSEVIVYHGDSIVHHLAAGIDFNPDLSR